jgi:penicillin-insensitive murein endopeptidase
MGIFLGMMLLGWGDVLKPNQGEPQSIGFYSSGCISGAETLPLDGIGYQVMRPSRNRFYGQPSTIQFVQNLGKTLAALQSGILLGDMSQPRGGPMVSGHASHQVGLDIDVWFWTHPEQNNRSLTSQEREKLPFITMLGPDGLVDTKKFTAEHINKLRVAALSPGVERIFVNPAIKTYLCAITPEKESAWLHALRPWAGHDEHFHVRLACPANSKLCTPQAPVPAGNGCNEVYPNIMNLEETDESFQDGNPLTFPVQCEAVLKDTTTKNQSVQNLITN